MKNSNPLDLPKLSPSLKRLVLQFGLLAIALILLLELSQYSLLTYGWRNELTVIAFGVGFIAFGILISRYVIGKQTTPPPPSVTPSILPSADLLQQLGISKREYEVLTEIAQGKSNQEIADSLSISENTVKTHVSKLLVKLDAKRRTQAISHAKEKGLIP
ncbi:MAG: response regulator transcription factor [Bacteroidota bacterium]